MPFRSVTCNCRLLWTIACFSISALLLGTVSAQQEDVIEDGVTPGYDHRAHSVPGKAQRVKDYDGDGFASVTLNAELSHTHYFRAGPPAETGKIVSYEWKESHLGAIIGTTMEVTYNFPVGVSTVTLTVVDNSGDSASNDVIVTVDPSGNQGAYMYCYDMHGVAVEEGKMPLVRGKELPALPPTYAIDTAAIDFKKPAAWPSFPFLETGPFAVRLVSEYLAILEDEYVFFLGHGGDAVELYIDGKLHMSKTTTGNMAKLSVADPVLLQKGKHAIELLYFTPNPTRAQLILGINLNGGVQAVPATFLSYESNVVKPTLHSITPDTATLGGGGTMKLLGAGFTSDSKVLVGPYSVSNVDVQSDNLIIIKVPTAAAPGDVVVTVSSWRGTSNPVHFLYNAAARMPIKFKEEFLKRVDGTLYPSAQFTSVAIGPDLRYYFGSLDTRVHVLTVAHESLAVISSCVSGSLGSARSITSVAFDPADKAIRAYVSTNTFYWRNWNLMSDEEGWRNGKVEALIPGTGEKEEQCLIHEKDVITGIPVSNHDHGANSIVFGDNGDMYVQVGGNTNAGYSESNDLIGGVPESPMSAATIVAHLRNPGFDGAITYSTTEPGEAKKTSPDRFVETFAFGFRNSYGSVLHSNGNLYATDNGPNIGYGKRSVTCNTEGEDPWHEDSLFHITKGAYFGFPNRARGTIGDPRQCVYFAPTETSRNGFTAALATFESSTNGSLLAIMPWASQSLVYYYLLSYFLGFCDIISSSDSCVTVALFG